MKCDLRRGAGLEDWANNLLAGTGIIMNGLNPWDPQVHDLGLYSRIMRNPSLGLGEGYMDGLWDCRELDVFFERLLRDDIRKRVGWRMTLPLIPPVLIGKLINLQSQVRAWNVGRSHYDLGNDLYRAMLGDTMAYSCGYWGEVEESDDDLDWAQTSKYDLICRKLDLRQGQRVLEIGCGWGGFARYAAKHCGVEVCGITVSKEQCSMASELCSGFPVNIFAMDYRELPAMGLKFDHVVSVGMFEHVGVRNYRAFMEIVQKCLNPEGLFLLHTIGSLRTGNGFDPWLERYIFPGGKLPSLPQITKAVEGLFVVEDVHSFGPDYDKTLMAWHRNFQAAWPELSANGRYDERFRRMWEYYLLSCAGAFRARMTQLWQIVLSPRGVCGGYESVR